MHTNSTLSEQDKLALHWGAARTDGARDSYILSPAPRIYRTRSDNGIIDGDLFIL